MPTDLPNLLTLSRIAAIPVMVALAALREPWGDLGACIVFSAAAITDYFDGKLARERQQTTAFGRMLDPIADKLLVGAALMLLAGMGRLSTLGLLPARTVMQQRLAALGYVTWRATEDGLLGRTGTEARGHEYHYSRLEPLGEPGSDDG